MKGLGKQLYIYTFSFLTKIVATWIWPSEYKITQTKMVIEQSLHWVTFLLCHSAVFSPEVSITNEEKASESKKKIIKVQKRCDYTTSKLLLLVCLSIFKEIYNFYPNLVPNLRFPNFALVIFWKFFWLIAWYVCQSALHLLLQQLSLGWIGPFLLRKSPNSRDDDRLRHIR